MMDGPGRGAYRIKVTIRFKVRRSERFVEKKNLRKGLGDGFIQKKQAFYLFIFP